MIIDFKLKGFTPTLTEEEYQWFERNTLSFKGFNEDGTKYLELLPSTIGNCYWFVCLSNTKNWIQDYTQRPISLSRIKAIVSFVNWNEEYLLKAEFTEPLPIDWFDEKPKLEKVNKTTNIYFIQSVIGGPVKIGKAFDIESRLLQHQIGSPFILRVVKVIENVPHNTEKELHKKYEKYRLHGEWFSEEILSIDRVNNNG